MAVMCLSARCAGWLYLFVCLTYDFCSCSCRCCIKKHTQSFENLEHWRTDFLHNAAPPNADAFPFILLGNKCDLEAERKVPKQKALQWAKSKGPNVSTGAAELCVGGREYTNAHICAPPCLTHPYAFPLPHCRRYPEPQTIPYFETSAKDATRVEGAFLEAAQLALQQTATQDKDE